MTTEDVEFTCPHCGHRLSRFALPEDGGWDGGYHLACFNDDCEYYVRGWNWMFERYGVRASYRYRIDPKTGSEFALPVWSPTAVRDRIVDDEPKGPNP